ncbi:hypothetical protein BJ912DRAFT_920507 [Pholiota molesta]|nr:hypothetical protein BJ912DRAFT_920507 [Pholiota molesta]
MKATEQEEEEKEEEVMDVNKQEAIVLIYPSGTSHGCAYGNNPNIRDFTEDEETNSNPSNNSPDGIVCVSTLNTDTPPNTQNPDYGFMYQVYTGGSIGSILKEIAKIYKPIEHKF